MSGWKPHPGFQAEFCSAGEYEVLGGGAAGPGKTDCLVALAARHIDKPGYRAILFRRTFPQLTEIMDRAWAIYPGLGGEFRATEKRWYFPAGGVDRAQRPFVALGHMQHEADKHDHQGKEYQFAGFDELTQFVESQYLYIAGSRVRSTNPLIPSRVRATTNPGGVGHTWVKRRFVDAAPARDVYIDPETGLSRRFIPARVWDNPTLVDNDPGYISRLNALPELERMRLLEGDWTVFDGRFFVELDSRIHSVEPFRVPPEWTKFMSLDWGYAKPFSVGWYALDYDGVLYRYREWYGSKDGESDVGLRLTAAEVAQGVLERERGEKMAFRVADPSIWNQLPKFRHQEAPSGSLVEDFQRAGVHFLKGDNNRVQGWNQVHKRFQPERQIDPATGEVLRQEPRFVAFSDLRDFWRLMPQITADPRSPEDIDTRTEDHMADEIRYACMARPVKPRHVERVPRHSFQAERSRLLRARTMAATQGVSLDEAYRRVR